MFEISYYPVTYRIGEASGTALVQPSDGIWCLHLNSCTSLPVRGTSSLRRNLMNG